ncbi:MAG: hypothetical protein RIC55_15540 [Pirellulaceae bacterium]
MKRLVLANCTWMLSAFLIILSAPSSWACTTAVISGKATEDGRPLLWKNRDFWQPHNEVVHFRPGQGLPFVAVVNAGGEQSVYMGVNTAGFCIENSVSNDAPGKAGEGPGNGRLMKMALTECTTVADFERLLQRTNSEGRRTRANFGVIDAHGGAAMFETGPTSYVKFDANDPQVAPQGFIVRSNFSATGKKLSHVDEHAVLEGVYSAERFRRGCRLCGEGVQSGRLDARYVLRHVARDLTNEQGEPISGSVNGDAHARLPEAINTSKTLNRRSTVSAAVFQGVRSGEDPQLTTMWVLLGQPAFSVAVPCWAAAGQVHEALDGPQVSRLCSLSGRLRELHYPDDGAVLRRGALSHVWASTFAAEDAIYERTQRQLDAWRRKTPTAEVLANSHREACGAAVECLDALCHSPEVLLAAAALEDVGKQDAAIRLDFPFDEPNGTRLGDAIDSVGKLRFDGGMTDSVVHDGSFRIRRGSDEAVNRYVDIAPNIGAGGSSGGDDARAPRGWIVMQVAGWNLHGDAANEMVRFGFTSQADKSYQTAGLVIARTSDDRVSLGGEAFGDGSTNIDLAPVLPARQREPVTFVIELDKVTRNSNEGDAGGVYRLFYRIGDKGPFRQAGVDGKVRRLRNGNQMHLRTVGAFGDDGEYFDIDRLYYTTRSPLE